MLLGSAELAGGVLGLFAWVRNALVGGLIASLGNVESA